MKQIVLIFILMTGIATSYAQEMFDSEEEYQKQYKMNIKKTHLDGVYIPANLEEALEELANLSEPEAMAKFAKAPVDLVAPKLHFGLGRWMAVNWKFYTGSRFSHILKTKGVRSPDAMSQFMIRALHAHLNDEAFDEKKIIDLVNRQDDQKNGRKIQDPSEKKPEAKATEKVEKN